jgi:signal transduction histidine kinase
MPQIEASNSPGMLERKRIETVMETLATLRSRGETRDEVVHDARNLITALGLYCDLLQEPGVLAPQFRHYGNELRLVAAASRHLVEKLVLLDVRQAPQSWAVPCAQPEQAGLHRASLLELLPATPIQNLAREVLASRNLLAALAGPAIALTVDAEGGALPVRISGEDLTRVLVNLVRNATEAMPEGGRIRIGLSELQGDPGAGDSGAAGSVHSLLLTVEDNGPGIPAESLEAVFASGYTTRAGSPAANGGRAAAHRGLGLAISRSIVEAAGGRIHAVTRIPSGARFEIVFPIASR